MRELVLGIDIGGTKIKYGLLSKEGVFVIEGSISTRAHDSMGAFLENLFEVVSAQLEDTDHIDCIGIGAPKGNQRNGCIEEAFNLIAWGDKIPIVEGVRETFGAPAFLLNDANAAAYGEKYYGEAKHYSDFLFITLGTGLGCGVFVNGQLVVGKNAAAGELGHVIVDPDGRYCGCGRQGCLETYVSAQGLMETIRKFVNWEEGIVVEEKYPDAQAVFEAAKANDPVALKAFEYTGKVFGEALANTAALFDPEAIILGGGVANAGEILTTPLITHFKQATLGEYLNQVEFRISDPSRVNMGLLGAASYASERIKDNPELYALRA